MKKYNSNLLSFLAIAVFALGALTSCGGEEQTEEEKAVEKQEIQNVDSMMKRDQEKMDSMRESLGI